MNTLSVAFCDDDPIFRSALRRKVEEVLAAGGIASDSFEASSGEEMAAMMGHRSFDLIFLDIDMPGMDGIRCGELLRARGCRSDIMYVSNMDDKVYEIFHTRPWSFVRKSRIAEELPSVLAEYVRHRNALSGTLLLSGGEGQTVPVDPSELVYVEAVGKTQRLSFFARKDQTLVRASLHDLEMQLAPHGFIRIHKGFLVNYRYIRKITSRSVLLDTGMDLPVGRDRLNAARERYLALMKWKGLGGQTGL